MEKGCAEVVFKRFVEECCGEVLWEVMSRSVVEKCCQEVL